MLLSKEIRSKLKIVRQSRSKSRGKIVRSNEESFNSKNEKDINRGSVIAVMIDKNKNKNIRQNNNQNQKIKDPTVHITQF